jgi:uncharacterized protein YggE
MFENRCSFSNCYKINFDWLTLWRCTMRKKTIVTFILLAAALIIGACSAAQAAPPLQDSEGAALQRTITVNGVGSVKLTPDIAHISIGVQTQNEDAGAAVAENNTAAQEIMDALADFGVAEADIQTSDFSIWPQQEYDPDGNITGTTYLVQNTVNVTVRELDQMGDLLDSVVSSGANSVYGISFDVADRTAAEAEALEAAVANADAQAATLAGAANVERGEVISMSSYSASPPVFPFDRFGMGGGAAQEASAAPITPGQLEIQSSVVIVYQIVP